MKAKLFFVLVFLTNLVIYADTQGMILKNLLNEYSNNMILATDTIGLCVKYNGDKDAFAVDQLRLLFAAKAVAELMFKKLKSLLIKSIINKKRGLFEISRKKIILLESDIMTVKSGIEYFFTERERKEVEKDEIRQWIKKNVKKIYAKNKHLKKRFGQILKPSKEAIGKSKAIPKGFKKPTRLQAEGDTLLYKAKKLIKENDQIVKITQEMIEKENRLKYLEEQIKKEPKKTKKYPFSKMVKYRKECKKLLDEMSPYSTITSHIQGYLGKRKPKKKTL